MPSYPRGQRHVRVGAGSTLPGLVCCRSRGHRQAGRQNPPPSSEAAPVLQHHNFSALAFPVFFFAAAAYSLTKGRFTESIASTSYKPPFSQLFLLPFFSRQGNKNSFEVSRSLQESFPNSSANSKPTHLLLPSWGGLLERAGSAPPQLRPGPTDAGRLGKGRERKKNPTRLF